MTLRDLMTCRESQRDPSFAVAAMCQVVRTLYQAEPATIEGCAASYKRWTDRYGKPCRRSIRKFLESLGETADIDIDRDLVRWALTRCN